MEDIDSLQGVRENDWNREIAFLDNHLPSTALEFGYDYYGGQLTKIIVRTAGSDKMRMLDKQCLLIALNFWIASVYELELVKTP